MELDVEKVIDALLAKALRHRGAASVLGEILPLSHDHFDTKFMGF
ncbi:hypothetical protein M2282_000031 [Variovorax boronicumulans]|nr:hypothetical protein [Variovorax boronicumulans]MDH6164903.1 hypothetical protein [Variovorax boronicumulans]